MTKPHELRNHYFLISTLVTPAEAGVQLVYLMDMRERYWIPAYAGMTAGRSLSNNSQPLSSPVP
jgi:hypothetical protein